MTKKKESCFKIQSAKSLFMITFCYLIHKLCAISFFISSSLKLSWKTNQNKKSNIEMEKKKTAPLSHKRWNFFFLLTREDGKRLFVQRKTTPSNNLRTSVPFIWLTLSAYNLHRILFTIFTSKEKWDFPLPLNDNFKIHLTQLTFCVKTLFLLLLLLCTVDFLSCGVLSKSRDAAISPIPVEAIEPLDPNRWLVTKTGPNKTSSFPWGHGRGRRRGGW